MDKVKQKIISFVWSTNIKLSLTIIARTYPLVFRKYKIVLVCRLIYEKPCLFVYFIHSLNFQFHFVHNEHRWFQIWLTASKLFLCSYNFVKNVISSEWRIIYKWILHMCVCGCAHTHTYVFICVTSYLWYINLDKLPIII